MTKSCISVKTLWIIKDISSLQSLGQNMPFFPASLFSFSPSSLEASQQNMWFTYLFFWAVFGLMWMFPDGGVERRRLGDRQLHQRGWPLLSYKIKCSNRLWENTAHSRLQNCRVKRCRCKSSAILYYMFKKWWRSRKTVYSRRVTMEEQRFNKDPAF